MSDRRASPPRPAYSCILLDGGGRSAIQFNSAQQEPGVTASRDRTGTMVKFIESKEEFTAITAKCGKLIVIDFTASWCGPCKTIAPVFEQCSKDFPNAEFYKVDVDDLSDVAEQCGIRAMPTFIFYKNGQRIDDLRGANTTELKAKIKRHCS
uniref:Thioredoxin domain-containing protein n=1 Tax=Leptobrachium leishanense TaxID=445787 RepID=A0A8C5P713_9ANUR